LDSVERATATKRGNMMSNELIDFENIPNGERLELVKTECGYRVIVL
jgi:hypothetical protein